MTISVSFDVAKVDPIALSCHYYNMSPLVRSQRLKTRIVVALALAFIGLPMVLTAGYQPLGFVLLGCAALFAVRYPHWHRAGLLKSIEKFAAESSYESNLGRYTLELTENGLISTSPIAEGKYSWKAIHRVALTPDYLFIFFAGPSGIPMPRTQVPDCTIQEVLAFAESHRGTADSTSATNDVA